MSSSALIPPGLSIAQVAQYETIINGVQWRHDREIKSPRVAVITDLAKDYDDLAALLVLKELHRLGAIVLLGLIANLMPARRRAQFGRGALDLLHLRDIPIAIGTDGSSKVREVHDYEFTCDFIDVNADERIESNGQDFLKQLCEDAVANGEKITLLLISSLTDIDKFSQNHPILLKKAVSKVVMQGGYSIDDGKLVPNMTAANNIFDAEAAARFHTYLQDTDMPSVVYTKIAAYATTLTSQLFEQLADTKHPLGEYLRKVQVFQDLTFYDTACNEDPNARFAPFMDQLWLLENRTSWFMTNSKDKPYPRGDEVIPYLDKVIAYDALAALGTSGSDILDALGVLSENNAQSKERHRVVGVAGTPSDVGIHPDQMATVLSALMKGALLFTSDI